MELVSQEDLRALLEPQDTPCLSIYMPTVRVQSQNQQNPIRFKNLLRLAEEQLSGFGLREHEMKQLLAPAYEMLADEVFWRHQHDGLAVFLSESAYKRFRLPISFSEQVVVNHRFAVKPLLPVFNEDGQYFLLTLAQKEVRFYRGSRYTLQEVQVPDMPRQMEDVLWVDEQDQEFRSRTESTPGRPTTHRRDSYHGHGGSPDDMPHEEHDELLRFFRKIDQALHAVLREEHAPLVLAGVEYYLPIYREVNSYRNLVEDRLVHGHPQGLPEQALGDAAWEIVQPIFQASRETTIARFQQHLGEQNGLASHDLAEIIPAAYYGRIETLFVNGDAERWGSFEPDENRVHLHPEQRPGDEDLFDLAAVHTLRNSGAVYVLDAAQMPEGEDLAAIFRYVADVEVEVQEERGAGS